MRFVEYYLALGCVSSKLGYMVFFSNWRFFFFERKWKNVGVFWGSCEANSCVMFGYLG